MRIMLYKRSHGLGLTGVVVVLAGCSSQADVPPRTDVADAAADAAAPGPSDGGPDADASTLDAHVLDAASSSDAAPSDATAGGPCQQIATQCAGADASSSLATTCLEVSESGDVESCEALADECLQYCDGSASDAGADGGGQVNVPSAVECGAMGEACHAFDEGHGFGNLCHEVGHARDLAVCAAIYDECEALCGEFHSDEDAAHGHEASDAAHGHEGTDATVHDAAVHDAASDAASGDAASE